MDSDLFKRQRELADQVAKAFKDAYKQSKHLEEVHQRVEQHNRDAATPPETTPPKSASAAQGAWVCTSLLNCRATTKTIWHCVRDRSVEVHRMPRTCEPTMAPRTKFLLIRHAPYREKLFTTTVEMATVLLLVNGSKCTNCPYRKFIVTNRLEDIT